MNTGSNFLMHEVRVQVAVAKRAARLREAIEDNDPPVSQKVANAVIARGDATEFDALTALLHDADPTIREEAAYWIDRHAQVSQCPSGWETWFIDEGSPGTLLEHLEDENANVKMHLLRAYPILKFGDPLQVLPKLVKNMQVPAPEIAIAALRAIQSIGQDLASTVVDAITKLLDDPTPQVREEAYVTVEWLGTDGRPALASLLRRIISDEKVTSLRHRAVLALIAQNPGRNLLEEVVADEIARLQQALCEVGEAGRELRHRLKEESPEATLGRDKRELPWITKADIARQTGVKERTVFRWIKERKLVPLETRPKGRTGKSLEYRVDPTDLEQLKKHAGG